MSAYVSMRALGPGIALWALAVCSAAAGTLSGKVTDETATPISAAAVILNEPGTTSVVDSTTTDINGDYSITVADGVYDVRVEPPEGSGLGDATIPGVSIIGDTTLDIVLIPSEAVTLSGVLRDRDGTPVPDQYVGLSEGSATTTAADGS